QIWLARALGLPELSYAHAPLVLGPDGRRLAKRHGDVTLREVEPRAAVAWMAASLGLGPAGSARELLASFDPDRVPREPTVWQQDSRPGRTNGGARCRSGCTPGAWSRLGRCPSHSGWRSSAGSPSRRPARRSASSWATRRRRSTTTSSSCRRRGS